MQEGSSVLPRACAPVEAAAGSADAGGAHHVAVLEEALGNVRRCVEKGSGEKGGVAGSIRISTRSSSSNIIIEEKEEKEEEKEEEEK